MPRMEIPHLVKARRWQEACRLLRLEASVRLLPLSCRCQSCNGISPCILALQRKCLSKCQDLTIYPQMRPLGRGATSQALWGKVTCLRSSWRLGIKNKALAPWWFTADLLARIKNSISGYFSLQNCHENKRRDALPSSPTIKSWSLKVMAVESSPQKGTLRIHQPVRPRQLEKPTEACTTKTIKEEIYCAEDDRETYGMFKICPFPYGPLRKNAFWLMAAVTGFQMGRPTVRMVLHVATRWPNVGRVRGCNCLRTQTVFTLSAWLILSRAGVESRKDALWDAKSLWEGIRKFKAQIVAS